MQMKPAFGVFFSTLFSFGAAIPVMALDLATQVPADGTQCTYAKACVVPGAEQDDEATIKARAVKGTGPAAGLVSDKRIKTDIREAGVLANGVKIYSFKFVWDDKVRYGVIAQELLANKATKKAVVTHANGLLGVDYGALGLRMATQEQFMKAGLAAVKADYKPEFVRSAKRDEPVQLFNIRPAY